MLRPDEIQMNPRLAECAELIDDKDYLPAMRLLLSYLQHNPKDWLAFELLSRCAHGLGDTGRAQKYEQMYTHYKIKSTRENLSETTYHLQDRRIVYLNVRGNKFDQLYKQYFKKHNEVRIITAQPRRDLVLDLDPAVCWADLLVSAWADEGLTYLTSADGPLRKKSWGRGKRPKVVTFLRSWEALRPDFMRGIDWQLLDGIIFVADHIKKFCQEQWRARISEVTQVVIHDSVDLSQSHPSVKGPGHNIAVVAYLGEKKGVELLLACLQEAVAIDPRYCMHFAGKVIEPRFQVYMSHLLRESGLENNFVSHGWVDDVYGFLGEMNYLISTSPWEACPNNIIEAMACGVKPIIHNWPGARELFPPDLVFNSVRDFAAILTSRKYDSEAYRAWVFEHFDADRQIPRVDEFLANILKS